MPTYSSAEKRQRQNEKRRLRNKIHRGKMRTLIKRIEKAIEDQNKDEAEKLLKETIPIIDKTAAKGIIHKNNAARKKSRLSHLVSSMKQE